MTIPEEETLDTSADDLFERLRADVRKRIDQRLDYATGKRASISSAFDVNPNVERNAESEDDTLLPWHRSLRFFTDEQRDLSVCENEMEAFTHPNIDRKLLILGEPGSGKTTALLKLADELLSTQQLPYIFELSSWEDDGKSFLDWMVAWLKFDYDIPVDVSRLWIQNNRLLPLLDGLDELDKPLQKPCVGKINEFAARTNQQVVVCCRREDSKQGQMSLNALKGALCIQPLTRSQIQQYLQHSKQGLWESVLADPQLSALLEVVDHDTATPFLQIPLFLQMFAIAYEPERKIKTKADLLETYISHHLRLETRKQYRDEEQSQEAISDFAYETAEGEPTPEQTKRYLIWFAKQSKKNARINTFLIERLQPSWLETTAQKWQYRLMAGLILGLSTGLLGDLITGLIGLIFGLLITLTGIPFKIYPTKALIFSFAKLDRKEFRRGLTLGLIGIPINFLVFGLLFGLINQLIDEPTFGPEISLRDGLIGLLIFCLIVGPVLGLIFGLIFGLGEKLGLAITLIRE